MAFTLIELLIVLGLIALLIAILVPALSAARSEARALKCLSNIRQLGMVLRLYALDNRDQYPLNVSTPTPQWWNDPARLKSYVAVPTSAMNSSSIFWCPEDDGGQQSYSMNIWASGTADKLVTTSKAGQLWPHHRLASPMLLLVAESWSYQAGVGTGFVPTPTIGIYGNSAAQRFGANGGVGPIAAGRCGLVNSELIYSRHRLARSAGPFNQPNGRVSIVFDDGHASLCADFDLIDIRTGVSSGLAAWSPLDYARN